MPHRISRAVALATLAVGFAGLTAAPVPALAVRQASYDACIAQRQETAALMKLDGQVFFELDLRGLPSSTLSTLALRPGDCISIVGLDRGTEAGLRRLYPQGGWLVEAQSIDTVPEVVRRRGAGNPNEDNK